MSATSPLAFRQALEQMQEADVERARYVSPCWCSPREVRPSRYYDDRGTSGCGQHGTDPEAREARGCVLCECGREETEDGMFTVQSGPTATYRGCRTCTTCRDCGQRRDLVDGELCDACDVVRCVEQERREHEAWWQTIYGGAR
jgi:hypothetical protein